MVTAQRHTHYEVPSQEARFVARKDEEIDPSSVATVCQPTYPAFGQVRLTDKPVKSDQERAHPQGRHLLVSSSRADCFRRTKTQKRFGVKPARLKCRPSASFPSTASGSGPVEYPTASERWSKGDRSSLGAVPSATPAGAASFAISRAPFAMLVRLVILSSGMMVRCDVQEESAIHGAKNSCALPVGLSCFGPFNLPTRICGFDRNSRRLTRRGQRSRTGQ